ncbi:DUF6287 domain-containing protein [Streptococcus ovuberis]|uniref:DUF6287 domain-containing protein n=1 Tax=Streptococcus ovuberis TaxID=1936207 RepID=A0A7X6S0Q3_9STRE|nr:DUF6287 domain-containing protein [Streptococcus ovuberis]NKZ19580.1 hypothetical protein [Streptococcus ovuberis]
METKTAQNTTETRTSSQANTSKETPKSMTTTSTKLETGQTPKVEPKSEPNNPPTAEIASTVPEKVGTTTTAAYTSVQSQSSISSEAIVNGEFNSIGGNWQNDLGEPVVFNNGG